MFMGPGLFYLLVGVSAAPKDGCSEGEAGVAGTVAGIRRVREAQAVYVVAYQSCMVEAPAPIDPTLLSDGSVSDDEAPRPAYMGPPLQP